MHAQILEGFKESEKAGTSVELSRTEQRLLRKLVENPGVVLSREAPRTEKS